MYRNKAILAGARGWLSLHFGCTGLTQPNTYKLPLRDTVDSDWGKMVFDKYFVNFDCQSHWKRNVPSIVTCDLTYNSVRAFISVFFF